MPAPRLPGIFCLETSWDRRLDDKTSVQPILDLLHRTGHARFIHRDVGTVEELDHYLAKWRQVQYADYSVLYFAFHGDRGSIRVGRRQVTLEELGDQLRDKASNRVVVFGSCDTLKAKGEVEAFRRVTKAKVVCGYTRQVGWLQSAAFELVMLGALVSKGRIDARVNHLRRAYPDQVKGLGFVSYPAFDSRLPSTA
jgi:hypothetical protein